MTLFECFKSEASFQQAAKVIDRFLTGFGWRLMAPQLLLGGYLHKCD